MTPGVALAGTLALPGEAVGSLALEPGTAYVARADRVVAIDVATAPRVRAEVSVDAPGHVAICGHLVCVAHHRGVELLDRALVKRGELECEQLVLDVGELRREHRVVEQ